MLYRKPPAYWQRHCSGADIFAGEPPVGAALQAGRYDDAIAVDAAIFLHKYSIRARRHRRAGEYADRFAGADRMTCGVTGSDPSDNGETFLAVAIKIVAAHGKTVDGRIVKRRHIDRSDNVLGEHAAKSVPQWRPLSAIDRRNTLNNQTLGLGNRKQRAVERKAIVAELRHQALSRDASL
jgi:hypothetical protein